MKQLVWLVLTIVATSTACHGKTNKYGTGWNPCALDQQAERFVIAPQRAR